MSNISKKAEEYELWVRNELAARFRRVRTTLMLSQREMALKSGLSRDTIKRIECAKTVSGYSERIYWFHLNYELEKFKNHEKTIFNSASTSSDVVY